MAFGGYTGGELWVHDELCKSETVKEHTLAEEDGDVSADYLAGRTFKGRVEDINGCWTQFDGNKLHFTLPFSGNRYSVIYFTCDRYVSVPQDVRDELSNRGLDFDWTNTNLEQILQQKLAERAGLREKRKEEAKEEAVLEMVRRGRCIGHI